MPTGETAPTSVQIKEGKDASGILLGWNLKGKIFCDAPQTEYKPTVIFLNEDTSYIIYFVAENPNYGILTSSTLIIFSTAKK